MLWAVVHPFCHFWLFRNRDQKSVEPSFYCFLTTEITCSFRSTSKLLEPSLALYYPVYSWNAGEYMFSENVRFLFLHRICTWDLKKVNGFSVSNQQCSLKWGVSDRLVVENSWNVILPWHTLGCLLFLSVKQAAFLFKITAEDKTSASSRIPVS